MSEQVLITKSKLNSLASKINNIVGETDKKTLDQMSTELTEIDSEIATQEDLIAQLQQAVDNLPDKDSGGSSGGSGVIETCNLTLTTTAPLFDLRVVHYINKDGVKVTESFSKPSTITCQKNSIIACESWSSMTNATGDIQQIFYSLGSATYYIAGDSNIEFEM